MPSDPSKPRVYKGVIIHRASRNSSGIRWFAYTPSGRKMADTLDGIKQLITQAIGESRGD